MSAQMLDEICDLAFDVFWQVREARHLSSFKPLVESFDDACRVKAIFDSRRSRIKEVGQATIQQLTSRSVSSSVRPVAIRTVLEKMIAPLGLAFSQLQLRLTLGIERPGCRSFVEEEAERTGIEKCGQNEEAKGNEHKDARQSNRDCFHRQWFWVFIVLSHGGLRARVSEIA